MDDEAAEADEVLRARAIDPSRGPFCAITKSGVPLPFPPTKREPRRDAQKNPRAVRRPSKSRDDRLPVKERQRYKDWVKRNGGGSK